MTFKRIQTLWLGFARWLAPAVCPFCEGGSGTIHDPALQTLKACEHCRGGGLAIHTNKELQELVDSKLWRRSDKPHNGNAA